MKLQKETESSQNPHGRWYNDACGTAFGMELIGERWSLLIVRELMLGGRRFSDIRASLPGISAKVLTERLESLEAGGVLVKRKLPPPAASQVYELTEWGYLAEPLIQELGRWAARSIMHDPGLPLSPVSLMLSMRTMLDKQAAKSFDATIGFEVAGEGFVAELRDGELPIQRGDPTQAQAVLRAPSAPVLAGMLYADIPMEALEAEAGLVVEGDRELIRRYASLFSLPPRIGKPAS
jgi:DNA-binding HxlR family transcriptional regulator